MHKLSIAIVAVLVLGLLGYFAAILFFSFEFVPSDLARVTIKNESGQNAKSVSLQYDGGTIEARGLENGEIQEECI